MTGAATMNNFTLGEMLGKGASAQVYRALHNLTGETVAIKSISLHSLSPSAQSDIMSEIDLLKNLNHPNIVKYKGFARDKDNLFIVLEYCETGSLEKMRKVNGNGGRMPERLISIYISQVLEGLIYLHEQGVIHRDIKGANILTNKDGIAKLADFGVSRRKSTGVTSEEDDNEVVGSPYWMAPEVIEQTGASTASDIWSVGCTVVELLEGKPPYGDLAPMQALWRIVQDESMRIPEGASPVVKDFLYHCFQKDPNLRITAKKLLRHPWMQSARKSLEPIPIAEHPPTNLTSSPSASMLPRPKTTRTLSGKLVPKDRGNEGTVRARHPPVYDEAVQAMQQWNDALKAPTLAPGSNAHSSKPAHGRKVSVSRSNEKSLAALGLLGIVAPLPNREQNDPVTKHARTGTQAGLPALPAGVVKRHVLVRNKSEQTEDAKSWDDDFLPGPVPHKLKLSLPAKPSHLNLHKHPKREENITDDPNQKTLRPSKSPILQTTSLPGSKAPSMSKASKPIDDYSDIGLMTPTSDLEAKFKELKLKTKIRRNGEGPAFLHPDQLAKARAKNLLKSSTSSSTSTSMGPPPVPRRSLSNPVEKVVTTPAKLPAPPPTKQNSSSPSMTVNQSPRNVVPNSPSGSRQKSLRNKMADTSTAGSDSQRSVEKYDNDWDDIDASLGSIKRQSLQLTRRSNKSWASNEDEWHDPFAEFEEDSSFAEEDLEAQILRDKRAKLCSSVSEKIDLLEPNTSSNTLKAACDELLLIFETSPEMELEAHFVTSHGMLAALELLESRLNREITVRLLRIVNRIVTEDVDALESFCLVGGIPVIIPFTSKKYPLESRLEASIFIQSLTKSALTLQMFISCRGLRILVEMLDEDYSENKTLVLSSLEGIGSVFDLQSPTPRNDFCRMFVREGILDPLSTALLAILRDEELQTDETSARAVNVLLLFCQAAQADGRVREGFATRMIMTRLLKACASLPRKLLKTAVKSIKHLSTSAQLIEVLQNSNALEILVSILGKSLKGEHANEICSYIFQTVFTMTRLSKARQEEAASSGIIPLLRKVIEGKSPLKQFALPILCDLANAGKVSRRLLWQNNGMKLYLDLLEDPYWRVSALDAILAWMSDETARVEDVLLDRRSGDCLVKAFVQASSASFEGILDPLLKILRLSTSVTSSISTTPFFKRLSDALSSRQKAVVKLNLLRLTRVVCDNHPERETFVSRFDLAKIVDRLAKQDEAILVRELAKEILPSLLFGNDPPSYHPRTPSSLGIADGDVVSAKRILETMKRSSSDNTPATSQSMTNLSGTESRDIGVKRESRDTRGGKMGGDSSKLSDRENRHSRISIDPVDDKGKEHKRKPSRGQLRDVQWQFDENGRIKGVKDPVESS